MGLDINYYSKLLREDGVAMDDDGRPVNDNDYVKFGESLRWSEGIWPGRAPDLDPDAIYKFSSKGRFRAGSYSGYGAWRRQLAMLAPGTDFSELIDFADNEGVIGKTVSAKLASDFARNQGLIEAWTSDTGETWFSQLYEKWRIAFEAASDDGAVQFC